MMANVIARFETRLRGLISVLFGRHDVSTPEGRAAERQRRAAMTALASMLAKVITVSTGLISVPLTLHYLGPERYGMWMTMSSAIALLSFADLGIGNGLLSSVASANGRGDRDGIAAAVSSAYAVLSLIAAALAVVFVLAYPHVDWALVFNVKTAEAREEAGPAVAALVGCVLLAMPLAVVQRTQMGMQGGFMASLWQCFQSIFGLVAVIVAIHFNASLPFLVLCFAGAPQVASILNSIVFFGWTQPDIAPDIRKASIHLARMIAGTGFLFLILQLVASLTFASDGLIIAHILGPEAVTAYAVPQRLFNVIGTVLAMGVAPLWPAYGEAIERGDHDWVKKTFKTSLIVSLSIATTLVSILVIFGQEIIHLWIGGSFTVPFVQLLVFGAWKITESIALPLAMYLNGARIVGPQVAVSLVTAVVAFVLKIYLTPVWGLPAVLIATIASFSLCTLLPLAIFWKTISRHY